MSDQFSIEYVAGVSWPRSGHHFLANFLGAYFGEQFGYCEVYTSEDCCKSFPCARPEINFSKNHDFDLALEKLQDQKYLVQYRDFLPSVVSNFSLYLRQGKPDTSKTFKAFARKQAKRYSKFVSKWVASEMPNRLTLKYEDVVAEPSKEFVRAVKYFAPLQPVNHRKVDQLVNSKLGPQRMGVRDLRVVEDFRYYDAGLFAELAAAANR